MGPFVLTFGCVLAVNLLPAFGPPTWAVLVFFKLRYDLPVMPMVIGGALCAASGRLLLAHASRHLRRRFSPERREHLAAAADALAGDRRRSAGALGLFALSPVPSAQLFVAAGLLDLHLLRLTTAFFTGRLASYAIYVSGAAFARESLGIEPDDHIDPKSLGPLARHHLRDAFRAVASVQRSLDRELHWSA